MNPTITLFGAAVLFASAIAQYTVDDAANYADVNDNGVIEEKELKRWYKAAGAFQESITILEITGNIPVASFRAFLSTFPNPSKEYTVDDAVKFADKDGNGEINGEEFNRWFAVAVRVVAMKTSETILEMMGNIPVETFAAFLSTKRDPIKTYTVEQAVKFADKDGNGEIDSEEFDNWYREVRAYGYTQLKKHMEDKDGVISKDAFKYVLQVASEYI